MEQTPEQHRHLSVLDIFTALHIGSSSPDQSSWSDHRTPEQMAHERSVEEETAKDARRGEAERVKSGINALAEYKPVTDTIAAGTDAAVRALSLVSLTRDHSTLLLDDKSVIEDTTKIADDDVVSTISRSLADPSASPRLDKGKARADTHSSDSSDQTHRQTKLSSVETADHHRFMPSLPVQGRRHSFQPSYQQLEGSTSDSGSLLQHATTLSASLPSPSQQVLRTSSAPKQQQQQPQEKPSAPAAQTSSSTSVPKRNSVIAFVHSPASSLPGTHGPEVHNTSTNQASLQTWNHVASQVASQAHLQPEQQTFAQPTHHNQWSIQSPSGPSAATPGGHEVSAVDAMDCDNDDYNTGSATGKLPTPPSPSQPADPQAPQKSQIGPSSKSPRVSKASRKAKWAPRSASCVASPLMASSNSPRKERRRLQDTSRLYGTLRIAHRVEVQREEQPRRHRPSTGRRFVERLKAFFSNRPAAVEPMDVETSTENWNPDEQLRHHGALLEHALRSVIDFDPLRGSNAWHQCLTHAATTLQTCLDLVAYIDATWPQLYASAYWPNTTFQDFHEAMRRAPESLAQHCVALASAVQHALIAHMRREETARRTVLFEVFNAAQESFKAGLSAICIAGAPTRADLAAIRAAMDDANEAAAELRYKRKEGEEALVGWDDEARKMLDELVAWLNGLPERVVEKLGAAVAGVKGRVRLLWKMMYTAPGCVPLWPL